MSILPANKELIILYSFVMKKFSKVLTILFFPIILILGLTYYLQVFSKKDHLIPKVALSRSDWQNIDKFIAIFHELWNYPDRLKEIDWSHSECPWWDFKNYHEQIDLRQNLLVFKCILEGRVKRNSQEKKLINFLEFEGRDSQGKQEVYFIKQTNKSDKFFQHLNNDSMVSNDYLPFEALELEIGKKSDQNFGFKFTLSFDQKFKLLPQANYYYGQDINQLPFQFKKLSKNLNEFAQVRSWDNIGRYLVIDKLPVRNYELNLWEKSSQVQIKLASNLLAVEEFVSYLTQAEQKDYCSSRGMTLMEATVFDAATYYRDIRNYKDKIERTYYYFGNRMPSDNKCDLQPTSECKNPLSVRPNFNLQVSWMGMMALTNDFESMANPFDPIFNLRPGSKYFKENSAWQLLANRMQWSTTGFSQEDFKWISSILGTKLESTPIETNLPIQFRCMKEWVTYP